MEYQPPEWDDFFRAFVYRKFFEKHGCIKCQKTTREYGGCMMCVPCLNEHVERLLAIEREM